MTNTIPQDINIVLHDALSKRYSLRFPMTGVKSVQATIPYEIVEREARKNNLPVEQFMQEYEVEYLYNHFGGAYMRFVKKEVR